MKISDKVSVGGQPSVEDLDSLAERGFKAVVNLRTDMEEDQPLMPAAEGEVVRAKGLEYLHLPVAVESVGPELVDRFREELASLPSPAYVHCLSGKRAGAFVMMDQGCRNGMSGQEVLELAKKMGFECDQPELIQFVSHYVDTDGRTSSK